MGQAIQFLWCEAVWHVRRHRRVQIGKFRNKLMLLEHSEGVPPTLSPGNEQVRRQENLVKSALVPSQIVDVPLINLNPCFCSRIGEAPDVEFVPIVVHPTYFLAPAGVVDNAQRGFRNQQVIHGFQRLDVVNVFFCQFVKATHCFSRVAIPVFAHLEISHRGVLCI